jgi:hypothetical protein
LICGFATLANVCAGTNDDDAAPVLIALPPLRAVDETDPIVRSDERSPAR